MFLAIRSLVQLAKDNGHDFIKSFFDHMDSIALIILLTKLFMQKLYLGKFQCDKSLSQKLYAECKLQLI